MAHKTRPAIEVAFRSLGTFVSAQELHSWLRDHGDRLGLATVYRELRRMVNEGIVDVVHNADGEARYRACGLDHHHHLICDLCGSTEEIDAAEIEEWIAVVSKRAGYTHVRHSIELIGVCRSCR